MKRMGAEAIEGVRDIVGDIATASDEQARGIEQVNQAMQTMDPVTQQNAALVEQALAAAQSLDEQAAVPRESVERFRLSAAGCCVAGLRVLTTAGPASPP